MILNLLHNIPNLILSLDYIVGTNLDSLGKYIKDDLLVERGEIFLY